VASEPLNDLQLAAASVADDVGFVALADVTKALGDEARGSYRLIGGRMVQIHVLRLSLGDDMYRETRDADVGVEPVLIGHARLRETLISIGYEQVEGNRFVREVQDVPVTSVAQDRGEPFLAAIDILVPARQARPKPRRVGDLVVDEVPGLSLALRRPHLDVSLTVRRLNGDVLSLTCAVPDELAALVLKIEAWRIRLDDADAVDVWRCLEVAAAAGVTSADLEHALTTPHLHRVREGFTGTRVEALGRAIGRYRGLDDAATRQLLVRLRALGRRVVGSDVGG
jgi:hypothetical protein